MGPGRFGNVKFDLFPKIKRFWVGSGRFDSTFGDALTTLCKY
jgi:hypothetical protein